jgi:hypothetical protein
MIDNPLATLLATLQPRLNPGVFAFVSAPADPDPSVAKAVATVREAEGLTLVVPEVVAQTAGWPLQFRAAWITLDVASPLGGPGLTAAVTAALAEADIACNVIAGVHHDHLFVPVDRGPAAVATLRALQQRHAAPR